MKQRVAVFDPLMRATIVWRKKLFYRDGADRALDRPAHLRAGSSLAWVGKHLVLIQDDANFVAIVAPRTGRARSITLPAGKAGLRQFDDLRGNKRYKFDFEACFVLKSRSGPRLVALGSGTKKRRRRILVIDRWDTPEPRASIVNAGPFYRRLLETVDFAGSEMNIEGALALPGILRLFGRGNGRAIGKRVPVNATCDLSLARFRAFLAKPAITPPLPRAVVQYDLGEIDGLRVGFTDAAQVGQLVLYTGAAEASKGATDDGRVSGSVIGLFPARGPLRQAQIRTARGGMLVEKVEGIASVPGRRDRAYIVIDPDDPTKPSELCEVKLSGY